MDTLLIPVFIVACLILFCECSAVLLYVIPVRFVLRLFHTEGHDEQSVLVSWGLIGLWITNDAHQQKITIYLGRRNILCRPIERGPKKGDEKKIPLLADFRSGERYFAFFSGMIKLPEDLYRSYGTNAGLRIVPEISGSVRRSGYYRHPVWRVLGHPLRASGRPYFYRNETGVHS